MPQQLLPIRKYQQEALESVQRDHAAGLTRVAVVLPCSAGKGHPLDTEVPTPAGLRLWGDLTVGDSVYGSDGRPTDVTGVFDRGELPLYRVAFRHGESVLVDGDHLWRVTRKGRKPKVVSTSWLLSQPIKDRDGYCWSTGVAAPVQRRTITLPLDPYVVGSLIANGGMTHDGTQLTTPDQQVIERVQKFTAVNPIRDTADVCPRYSLPGLTKITRELGMRVHSHDKTIPRAYLEASVEQRIALLQGLMVGDGSAAASKHPHRHTNYYTSSSALARDMKELVTSLGGTATINQYDRGDKGIEYQMCVSLPFDVSPFDTDRKQVVYVPRRLYPPKSVITSIEPAGRAPVRCISVDAPDDLYLITRDHIVTHNTVIFSYLIAERSSDGRQSLVLVHRDELVSQSENKLHSVAPSLSTGIVKAERNELNADVVIASVQTLSRPNRLLQLDPARFGLVVADECHLSAARSWQDVLHYFDGIPTVGFTATFSRHDDRKLADTWEKVSYQKDILWGIKNNWLVDVSGLAVTVDGLDLARVARSRGDYQPGELGDAMIRAGAGDAIARAYIEHAQGRSTILFAPSVESVNSFADSLNAAGITTDVVVGTTPLEDRRLSYKRFAAGEVKVLASVDVLSVGFDMPQASCAIMARPTESHVWYVQAAGRILRPWPAGGKKDALIIDMVGISKMHALRGIVDLAPSGVVIKPGESVGQAAARHFKERTEAGAVNGQIAHTDVDLFHSSASVWLQTDAGIWFVPTTDWTFFIVPEASGTTWKLGRKATYQNHGAKGGWLQESLTLEYAMSWGESLAAETDPSISSKRASWRRKGGKPTDAQIGLVGRYKLPYEEGMTKSQVSDLISVHMASNDLRAFVKVDA